MLFKSLSLLALSAGALAALEERQLAVTDSIGASVLLVLATAIPPESIVKATADPAAFSAELASSLSAGQTPEWYQALPSDVKSYLPKLYPASNVATSTQTAIVVSTSTAVVVSTSVATSVATISGGPTGGNSSTIATVSSATLRSTGGANSGSPTGGPASTGGASYPTAVVGAGVAGALGFLGMLAL